MVVLKSNGLAGAVALTIFVRVIRKNVHQGIIFVMKAIVIRMDAMALLETIGGVS
jgi:hypothetical protein